MSDTVKVNVVTVNCCGSCARQIGFCPKVQADIHSPPKLCDVCGQHDICSTMELMVCDWGSLRQVRMPQEIEEAISDRLSNLYD